MELTHVLILVGAGLAGGAVAGMIGVGGGIIFAPVLFFFYRGAGVPPEVIAPLTIGTSLLCTLLASLSSAYSQFRRASVDGRVAVQVGCFSAVAVFLMTRYVTTQPWYDGQAFQVVFALVLLSVAVRMVAGARGGSPSDGSPSDDPPKGRPAGAGALAGMGAAAGGIASAAGVGGGIVLVPSYHHLLHLPMHRAVGTSSATIVLISLVGVVTYLLSNGGALVPGTAVGYVDVVPALLLAVPAVVTARAGVWLAHRTNRRTLRLCFALIAAFVSLRMLWNAV